MKTITQKLKMLAALLLLTLGGGSLSAQLSGLYTIDGNQATGGTNYQTFTDFANDINTNGVNGPVTVNVSNGPFNEQVKFNDINGASANNRIVINGNGNLISYNCTSGQPWIVALDGTDYMTINELQVLGLNTTYAFCLKLWNSANFNIFSACSFSVQLSSTGTQAIPVSISGNGTSYSSSSATTADYNKFLGCTTYGGYAGIAIYRGTGTAPYNQGGNNEISGCMILDFYYAGIWNYAYENGTKILYNTFKCPTRTNTTTKYGIFNYGAQNTIIEGNFITELYGGSLQTSGGTCYGIYCWYNTTSSYTGYQYPSPYKNIIRNNIIADIKFNGTLYGIQSYYYDGEVYNNTISLDHAGATGGNTYGIYTYGYQSNYVTRTYNNIVTITRGGSGTKYCYYNVSGTTGSDVYCDRNVFYMGSTSGANYIGYHTGTANTLAQLISQGANQTGFDVDPAYTNPGTLDFKPTNVNINNQAIPAGLLLDQRYALRNQATPDVGAIEFLTPLCSGTPTQTVAGPNWELCPGEVATFTIGGLSADDGVTYQWQMSNLSNVGPFTVQTVASPTNISFTSPPNTTTMWYSAIISCTAPGGNSVQAVAQVTIANTTTNTVPYFEGFEGIGQTNRLPNCSWSAPNIGGTAKTHIGAGSNNLTPRSGSSFASFNTPGSADYYYTNGIYMVPGVTYSASLWYQTDLTGANNWSDLSILLGTAQNPSGLTTIATTGGPAVAIIYKSLSNTFTVPNAGFYYVAVRATGSTGNAMNLSWDDLRIEIPCQLNTPTVTTVANKTSICAGESVNLTASGADNYVWDNGAGTGSMVTVTPQYNTYYTVTGTHANSGCSSVSSQMIQVKPSPVIGVVSYPSTVCDESPVNLQAYGATSYNWSNNKTGASIIVTPSGPTNYTLQGTNSHGCTSKVVYKLTPFPKPVIQASAPAGPVCMNEELVLSASGASSFLWKSNNVFVTGNPVFLYPHTSANYTVEGTDENGCKGETIVSLNVQDCTGLTEAGKTSGVSVYPNPNNGSFTVETGVSGNHLVVITDVAGRVIFTQSVNQNIFEINISEFSAGIYYVEVSGADSVERIKVIRN